MIVATSRHIVDVLVTHGNHSPSTSRSRSAIVLFISVSLSSSTFFPSPHATNKSVLASAAESQILFIRYSISSFKRNYSETISFSATSQRPVMTEKRGNGIPSSEAKLTTELSRHCFFQDI